MFQALSARQQIDKTAEEFPAGEGLRFRRGKQLLQYLQNRSEEAPCRPRDSAAVMEDPAAAEEAAEAVDATVLTLMHAWNHHDMRAWAACFTEDADYVDLSGAHWRGRPEIEAKQIELHATAHRNSTMRISEWSIRFLSAQTCLVDMRWDMKGGSLRKRKGMLTMVLVPDGTGWRATAAQNSDSFRSSS